MRSLRLACALAVFLVPAALPAQNCAPALLGADRRGPAESISRSGSTLYVGTGAALLVVDVTVRSAPVERGFVNLDGLVRDVAAAGSIAVVLADSGLVFVDATDPDHPAIASSWPIPDEWEAENVAVRSTLAFVPATDGLHVVDFANPASPDEIGFLAAPGTKDFVPRGTSLGYLVAAGSLVVVDFSDPTSPSVVSSQALPSGADDALAIGPNGGQLAVWGNSSSGHLSWWDLAFYSLADPDSPAVRSNLGGADDSVSAVVVAGDRAYLDRAIVDVSNLTDPTYVGVLPADYVRAHATTGDPGLLYVADYDLGILTVDVSDAGSPEALDRIELPAESLDSYVSGEILVVLDRTGLRTLDISDPRQPLGVGELRPPFAWMDSIVELGTHALVGGYFVDWPFSSRVVDLSDPQNPVLGGDLPWSSGLAKVDGSYLYALTGCAENISIFDVQDPADPLQISQVPLIEGCWDTDFAVAGSRLYLWEYAAGYPDYPQTLRTFDVSDPATPVELAAPIVPQHRGSSAARGRTVVLAEADSLEVLNLSDPAHPASVGTTPLPASHGGIPRPLELYASRAGVGTEYDYLGDQPDLRPRIIDLSSPAAPFEWAVLDTPGTSESVSFAPGIIVVADGAAGFSIFESCIPFADGFESGDTSEWSLIAP